MDRPPLHLDHAAARQSAEPSVANTTITMPISLGQATMATMDIKPIKSKADYEAALKTVESLMTAKARTPEGDRPDVLVTLIEAYERQHFPMDAGAV